MSVYFEIEDLDEVAANLSTPPMIVNDLDLDFSTEEGKAELARYLTSTFDGDTISPIPSCICGHYTGEHRVGRECPKCNVKVMNLVDRPADFSMWVAPPKGVKRLINPEVWTVLNAPSVHAKRFSVLEWVCDYFYREKYPELQKELDAYEQVHKRGLNYFIENFDAVMNFLLGSRLMRFATQARRNDYIRFIERYRSRFFPQMLPVMSRMFIVTENSPMGLYNDDKSREVPDAIYTITSATSMNLPLKRRESHATKAIVKLAKSHNSTMTKFIGGKWGLIRRQLIGSRLHFTCRAVITSLSEDHRYDELHIPWGIACQLLRYHILAKLLREPGMTPNEAIGFLEDHTLTWHPKLRKIFDELIAEAWEGKGIPLLLQRNPTLTRGSAQLLRVTKIKDNIHDNTISLSVLILKPYNADFDGRRCRRKSSLIAGNSLESLYQNEVRKDKRQWFEKERIGQSATKLLSIVERQDRKKVQRLAHVA